MLLSSPADSTFDSGQGSTVYSDSQSSQQSVVLGSLADAAPLTAQSVCSAPVSVSVSVSVSEGLGLPHSLPSLGAYPQPATVSQLGPAPKSPCTRPGAGDGPSAVQRVQLRLPEQVRRRSVRVGSAGCRLEACRGDIQKTARDTPCEAWRCLNPEKRFQCRLRSGIERLMPVRNHL